MNPKIKIFIFIIIIGAGASFFFLMPSTGQNVKLEKDNTIENAIPVKITTIKSGLMQNYIQLSGDVNAASSIDVMPDVSGRLNEVKVKLGDYVLKNQILALVDPSRPGSSFELSPVKAPIEGTVTRVTATTGKTVAPTLPLFQIGQLDELEIIAQVSERYIPFIKKGQKAIVKTQAGALEKMVAFVSEISPVVNNRTRTMEITLSINNNYQYLKAGMLIDLTLIIENKTKVMSLPENAIKIQDNEQLVYVLTAENKAEVRKIKTGLRIDGYAEIIEGLSPGDKVILSGMTLISDGSQVTVMEEIPGLSLSGNLEE